MPPVEEFETTCPNCKKDFDVRSDDAEVSCPHCEARVRLVESPAPAPAPAPTPTPVAPPYVPPAPPTVVVKEPGERPVKVSRPSPPQPPTPPAPKNSTSSLRQLLRIAEPDEDLLEAKAQEARLAKAAKAREAEVAKQAKVRAAKERAEAKARDKPTPAERTAKATGGSTGFARLNFLTRRERTPLDSDEAVPILEIEGIGPAFAQKLGKAGIVSSDDFLGKDLKAVSKKTGIEVRDLQKWQDMADLIHVKGIGPQFAEVLVRCDINSVAELARQDAKPLALKIQEFLDSKKVTIVGSGVSTGRAKSWIKEARRLAPPPADVGKKALKAVQGKREPSEDVPAKRGSKVDDRLLAEDAKKEAERGFMTRFARRNVVDVPRTTTPERTTIGNDIPVARKSLFRRDPEAAARRAALREESKTQKQRDAETAAKAKAATDADKAKAKAQREADKAEERRQADARKAKEVAARKAGEEARQREKLAARPVKTESAVGAAAPVALAAATPRKGLPFLSRAPLETVDCAHCAHRFSVKATQAKATCPNCHSVLALVSDSEPLPAVVVKAPSGKQAPTSKPIVAAVPASAPARAEKPVKPAKTSAGKAPSATGAALLADSKVEPADDAKAQKLLSKQAALEGARNKDEAAKAAKAQEQAAASDAKAKAKLAKAEAKAKAKETKGAAKAAKKEEKLKLKQAKQAAKEAAKAAKAKDAAKPEDGLAKPVELAAAASVKGAKPVKGGNKSDKALPNAKGIALRAAEKAKSKSGESAVGSAESNPKKALKLAAKEEKRKVKEAKKAAKLAAKADKEKAKAEASAAKLASKGKQDSPSSAKGAKVDAKVSKEPKEAKDLSPRQLAKLEKQKAKDEERRKREMAQREADKARLAGVENAGLWAQATARPLPKANEGHGVWESSVEERRAAASSAETKAERKTALSGKVRLVDGRSLFSRLPEDKHERKPPRLPDGESPFKHLAEDDKVPQGPPRLADGRSAFERLPEDDAADYERIQVFGHKPGREYTTKGGFHITEEVIATETAPEVELGTKKDRASRKAAKEDERRKKKEDKEQKKAAAQAAKEEARQRREQRAAKVDTKPLPPPKVQPVPKSLAGKPVGEKAAKPAEPKLSFKERLAAMRAAKPESAESKLEAKAAAKAEKQAKVPQTKQSLGERLKALKEQRAKAAAEKAKEKELAQKVKAAAKIAAAEDKAKAKAAKDGAAKAAKGTAAAKAVASADLEPQCSALTEDGAQCRNSARKGSDYCRSHKGYQPPTAKGLAKLIEGKAWRKDDKRTDRQSVDAADTDPAVAKAKDTKLKVRKEGVPLSQRLRGFLPAKKEGDEKPTKADKSGKPVKPAKPVKGDAPKKEGPSFAERLKLIQVQREKAALERAKEKEAAAAARAKLDEAKDAQKAKADAAKAKEAAKASKLKEAEQAKLEKAKAAAAKKDESAKARAAKDKQAAKASKLRAKQEKRAAKLEAKAEARRKKDLAREAKLAAKPVGEDTPASKRSMDDGERDRRIRLASKEQARLDKERARSERQAAKVAAKAKAREEKQAAALAKAEARTRAATPVAEAEAPVSVAAPAPPRGAKAKPRSEDPAWEPPSGSGKAAKARGRRGASPQDALRGLLPAATSVEPAPRAAVARPEAPPQPTKPAVERVAVERVIEKTVVQRLAYDRAKIDAALRSHGQQPPR